MVFARRACAAALAAVLIVGLLPCEGSAGENPGPSHKNESWGFKVRVPQKWNIIHMDTKEQWIAMKAIGPRDLYGPKGEGWGERPEMWVIAFPHARQRDRGAKREKVDDVLTVITIENPYKDYKDFVKREKRLALGSAGFFFSVEEEDEVADMKVLIYEVKAEKMTDVPKRLVCWVYETEDVDYAIQFKVYDNHYDDYESTFRTCLKSFRLIPRTKPFPGSDTTGEKITDVERESQMTPEERRMKRMQEVESYIADEIDNLPKDWNHDSDDHFCVISHADAKFTKRILAHAENVRAYLEKMFPGLGDEYVPRGVIRIFQDDAEKTAFTEGTRSIWFDDVEQILVSADKGFGQLWEFEQVSRDVTRQWLFYKNRNLYDSMPYWLGTGLMEHMEKARPSKSKKLVFAPDTGDVLELVKLAKSGKTIPIKDFFLGESEKAAEDEDTPAGMPSGFSFPGMERRTQAASIFHYLMTKGNRGKFKGAVQMYLTTLVTAIEEEDKKFEAAEEERRQKELEAWKKKIEENDGEPPEESDEDDEKADEEARKRWQDYSRRLADMKKAIAQTAFDAAFGELGDSDWERLDKSWLKYAEKGGK